MVRRKSRISRKLGDFCEFKERGVVMRNASCFDRATFASTVFGFAAALFLWSVTGCSTPQSYAERRIEALSISFDAARSNKDYAKAGQYAEERYLLAKQSLDPDDYRILLAEFDLCLVKPDQDYHQEALPICRRLLKSCRERLGNYHQLTLKSLNNLAHVHINLGQYDEAESLLAEAIHHRQTAGTACDRCAVITEYNLALAYEGQGRFAEAKNQVEKALALGRQHLGETDSFTQEIRKKLRRLNRSKDLSV